MVDPWASLRGAKYISLTTFRRNGVAVPTPVWFAQVNGHVVVYTLDNSGKIKRIRNNEHVELAASDARGKIQGPTLQGTATIIPASQAQQLEAALNQKYFWKRLFNLFTRLRRAQRVYLQISPAS